MSKQEDRVLGRRGARIVTTEEAMSVKGSGPAGTATVCTFNPKIGPDGDVALGEC